jgi:regulator of replication initiation timing
MANRINRRTKTNADAFSAKVRECDELKRNLATINEENAVLRAENDKWRWCADASEKAAHEWSARLDAAKAEITRLSAPAEAARAEGERELAAKVDG